MTLHLGWDTSPVCGAAFPYQTEGETDVLDMVTCPDCLADEWFEWYLSQERSCAPLAQVKDVLWRRRYFVPREMRWLVVWACRGLL